MWGERKQKALEWEASEFKRTFPTCPICGSDLGYDISRKFLTYYVRCKSCEAVWEPTASGTPWKLERRYLLVKPDKDMRASSLVGKGDKWIGGYLWSECLGYKAEFWKSLDLEGLKTEPTAAHPLSRFFAWLKAVIDRL
jgi:hypothetical protein